MSGEPTAIEYRGLFSEGTLGWPLCIVTNGLLVPLIPTPGVVEVDVEALLVSVAVVAAPVVEAVTVEAPVLEAVTVAAPVVESVTVEAPVVVSVEVEIP